MAMPAVARTAGNRQIVEIRMWGGKDGAKVGFDPIGILVEPGQTVQWLLDSSVHTGALPFDHFVNNPRTAQWRPVPDAAVKAFPAIDQIMGQKIIRFPGSS